MSSGGRAMDRSEFLNTIDRPDKDPVSTALGSAWQQLYDLSEEGDPSRVTEITTFASESALRALDSEDPNMRQQGQAMLDHLGGLGL